MKTKLFASLRLCVIIFSVLFLTGCRYSSVDYTPQPGNITSKDSAKEIISDIFSQQYRMTRKQQIVVKDDRIVFANDNTDSVTKGEIVSGQSYFFKDITHLTLYQRRDKSYKVIGWSGRVKLISVICLNETSAKQFIDAIKYMSEK